jgi:hypothetical protein
MRSRSKCKIEPNNRIAKILTLYFANNDKEMDNMIEKNREDWIIA